MGNSGNCDDRFLTMSLGTLGPATIPNKTRVSVTRDINCVGDIEGAKPELKFLRYTCRPNFYGTDDIDGTAPMKLHKKISRCDDDLAPVEGSVPKRTFFKTSRVVDPLDPDYKLPSCCPAEPCVPRFLRDGYTVTDIDGTAPRSKFRFAQRETHDCKDIEGAQSGWRPRNERVRRDGPPVDFMSVKDINDSGFKTRRTTNPLRPEHSIHGRLICDDMQKTMPKKPLKAHTSPFFSLHTQDIEGAQCGWRPPHAMQPPLEARRHFRNINFVGDIEGAQPDTVKHAIRTKRKVNPLNPAYTSLDGGTLDDPTKPAFMQYLGLYMKQQQPDALKVQKLSETPAAAQSDKAYHSTDSMRAQPSGCIANSRREAAQLHSDIAEVRALP